MVSDQCRVQQRQRVNGTNSEGGDWVSFLTFSPFPPSVLTTMGSPALQESLKVNSIPVVLSAFLVGMVLGLDVSIFIMQLVKSPRYHSQCLEASAEGIVGDVPAVVRQFQRVLEKLISFGCTPVLVFDGCRAFAPKAKERARREEQRLAALQLLRSGTVADPEARRKLEQKSFKPGRGLMSAVARMACSMGIPFLFAPFQADQQLVYLEAIGTIDVIGTGDSDLVVRGRRILYALDVGRDEGRLYVEGSAPPGSCELSLLEAGLPYWRRVHLKVVLAVLGGCDYGHLPGIGPKRAMYTLREAVQRVGAEKATIDNLLEASVEVLAGKGWIAGTRAGTDKVLLQLRGAAYAFGYEPVFAPNGSIVYPFPTWKRSASVLFSTSQGFSQGSERRSWTEAVAPPPDVRPFLGLDENFFYDAELAALDNEDMTQLLLMSLGGAGAVPAAAQCVGGVPGGLSARPGDAHPPQGAHLVPAHVPCADIFFMLGAKASECLFLTEGVVPLHERLLKLTIEQLRVFLAARGMTRSDSKKLLIDAIIAMVQLEAAGTTRLRRVDDPAEQARTLVVRDPLLHQPPQGPNIILMDPEWASFAMVVWNTDPGSQYVRLNYVNNNTILLDCFPHLSQSCIFTFFHGMEGMKADVSARNRCRIISAAEMANFFYYRPRKPGDSHWVTFHVTATIAPAMRKVSVEFSVASTGSDYPFISKILYATCDCKQGALCQCVHVMLVLRLMHLMPITNEQFRSPTSAACLWNRPSDGLSARYLREDRDGRPAACYPRIGEAGADPAEGRVEGDHLSHFHREEVVRRGGRGALVPLPPRAQAAGARSAASMAARAGLWAACAEHIHPPPHPSPLHAAPPRCLDQLHYALDEDERMMLFMTKEQRRAYMEQCSKEEAAAALLGVGGAGSAGQGAGAGGGAGIAGMLTAEPPPHELPDDSNVMGGCGAEDLSPSDVEGDEEEETGPPEASASAAARQEGAEKRAQRRSDGATTARRKRARDQEAAQAEGEAEAEVPEYKRGPRSRDARPFGAHFPDKLFPKPGTLADASDPLAQGRYLCFYCGYRRKSTHFKNGACKYRESWQSIMERRHWEEPQAGKSFKDSKKPEE